jgi:FkbM family methyltransferase
VLRDRARFLATTRRCPTGPGGCTSGWGASLLAEIRRSKQARMTTAGDRHEERSDAPAPRASWVLRASRLVPPWLKGVLRRVTPLREAAEYVYRRASLRGFPVGLGELVVELDVRNPVERGLVMGGHEPYVASWLRKNVGRGWVCVDVGAHIGWYTVQLAWLVGPEGLVVAFEPVAVHAHRLRRNLARNGLANIEVVAVALSDRSGRAALWAEEIAPGLVGGKSSLVRRSFPGHELEVPVDTLDAYVARRGLDRIDLLKVDVEGSELEVLAGSRDVLSSRQPTVIVEFNDEESRTRVEAFLRELGYRCKELGRAPSMVHVLFSPA